MSNNDVGSDRSVSAKCGQVEEAAEAIRLYRPSELANLLQCTDRTLRNWRRAGLLTAVKIRGSVYFEHQDVLTLIERMRSGTCMKSGP